MTSSPLRIAARFNGPPELGNGGYVCGTLARHLGPGPLSPLLLGEMTAELLAPLRQGEPVVAYAWRTGQVDERRFRCGSALAAKGRVLAHASGTWFRITL